MDTLLRQSRFRPDLPVVIQNVDYQRREADLKRMDEILRLSGVEKEFETAVLERWLGESSEEDVRGDQIVRQRERARRALRCVLLMSWLELPYREMSVRLAECPLYQWFCELDGFGGIRVPSKSELCRFVEIVDEPTLRKAQEQLLRAAAEPASPDGEQPLKLKVEIELESMWLDSTALKADIHFPVDWTLLRDATVTLMKATKLIRDHGIKHRMADPEGFIKKMNRLSMEMSTARRRADSKRKRKRVLRKMKKMVKTVRNHALRHRDALEKRWRDTDWTEAQANVVIDRIDQILLQLPAAIDQAHERIIGERPMENSKKVLSLYEADVHVIVRGKASAEVEFGNTLLVGEQKDGLVMDWKLFKDAAPNDSQTLKESVERFESAFGEQTLKSVVADRQFDSQGNRQWLEEKKIYNGLCPRSVEQLENKSKSAKFQKAQRRRAQTEARIAILKNDFLGNPIKRRGFASRERQVAWSILAHNLWLLARREVAEECLEPPARAA